MVNVLTKGESVAKAAERYGVAVSTSSTGSCRRPPSINQANQPNWTTNSTTRTIEAIGNADDRPNWLGAAVRIPLWE